MNEQMKVWKFLAEDRCLQYGDGRLVEVGKSLSVEGEIIVCKRGIHGCERALDALPHAPGTHLAYGALSGDLRRNGDKVAGRTFVAEKIIDATQILQEFALWCANEAIKVAKQRGDVIDPCIEEAVAVVRRFLDGDASKDELNAAVDAVDAAYAAYAAYAARATYAAAYATYAAAYAARDAADAADAAAYAAHVATYAAARDAATRKAQADKLEELLKAEMGKR